MAVFNLTIIRLRIITVLKRLRARFTREIGKMIERKNVLKITRNEYYYNYCTNIFSRLLHRTNPLLATPACLF